MKIIKVSELHLEDVVRLGPGPNMVATVQQFYWPHVTCYRFINSAAQVELLERRAVPLK